MDGGSFKMCIQWKTFYPWSGGKLQLGFIWAPAKKMKSSGLKRVFPFEFRLWLRSPKSWWLEWEVIDIQQGQAPDELADRRRMKEQKQKERSLFQGNSFSGAKDWNSCQWYVPKGEQEKTGKARMSVGVEVGGWFAKLNWVSFCFSSATYRRG